MSRREGRNGFKHFRLSQIDAVAQKRQIVHMKNRANDFFVLDQGKSLINCCCDSNLKLEIGTKEIRRKKKNREYFYR